VWKYWNGTAYTPFKVWVGDPNHVVQLNADSLTTNRVQNLQDKDGTIALTSDLFSGRPTQILSGATPSIDWSSSGTYSILLSANTTFTSTLSQPGQEIYIAITNPSTYTVTWPSNFTWPGGTPPTQSVTNKTDLYRLKNVAGTIYGEQKQDFS
jgi:hypothetical protein